MLAKRYGISLALGAIVTTVLFLIMQAVIASDEAKLDEGAKGKLLELVRLEDDEEIQTKQRKPKPPPPPDEPPRRFVCGGRRGLRPGGALAASGWRPQF